MTTHYVFPPSPPPSIAVNGSAARFAVHRIYCVGRNYAEHAREMGGDPNREPPFFFAKPADAVVPSGATLAYPTRTTQLHHEVELVVAIGRGGRNIARRAALDHVYGYAVGIDLTRRDLQNAAKAAGKPWDTSKGFDASAPVGALRPVEQGGHVADARIRIEVNGEVRQNGNVADMIWPVPDIVAELSTYYELAPGDLIFTGTPAGVGPLKSGDRIVARVDGLPDLHLAIA